MCRDVILLKHNKKLKLKSLDSSVGFDFDSISNDQLTIYTFSSLNEKLNKKVSKEIKVDGTTRFTDKHQTDIGIVNFRSMSPFYANIIWDLAHHLEVGKKIFVIEMNECDCVLDSGYYSSAFKLIEKNNNFRVYEKTESLAIEKNSGLSSWTFGIPVGPEEPTVLNCCVARILELGIDDFEIILCGRPHRDFKYFDKVKIVGEEITAPPVHITRKKNEIVRNATKDNLCILHDRVLLPLNFLRSMENFGDLFPMVGFQSVYFTDYLNLIPRRYSDFGVLNSSLGDKNREIIVDKDNLPYQLMKTGCTSQHCQCADFSLQYLTGSLCITKRELWLFCPQNEDYYWDEYEDIECSIRASSYGIPVVVNPFSLTQSMNARSIIHDFGSTSVRKVDGGITLARSITELLPFLKLKPLFRITEDEARRRFYLFAKKYSLSESILLSINTSSLDGISRYKLIFEMVMQSTITDWNVESYINDFCSLLLHEDMPPIFKERLKNHFYEENDAYSKKMLFLKHTFVLNQLSYSLTQSLYLKRTDDIFITKRFIHNVSALVLAFYWKFFSKIYYFNLSVKELSIVIINTTPFKGTD